MTRKYLSQNSTAGGCCSDIHCSVIPFWFKPAETNRDCTPSPVRQYRDGAVHYLSVCSETLLSITCLSVPRQYCPSLVSSKTVLSIRCLSVPRLYCLSPVCQYWDCTVHPLSVSILLSFNCLSVSSETILSIPFSVPRLCCPSTVCQYSDCAVLHLSVSTQTVLSVNCLSVLRLRLIASITCLLTSLA